MRKKRVSKKKKIAWRKHVNIDDIENFLEDKRLEERLGLKSSLSDQQLFTLDKAPKTDELTISKKERSRLRLANPRCFQILKPHTKVPDPLLKRNRVRTKEERKNLLVKLKEKERKAKGILKAKEIDSIKGKEYYEKQKLNRPKRGDFLVDIWENGDNVKQIDEWISEDATVHNLRQTGTYLKEVIPSVQKRPTQMMSVEPPHPGMSYNPSFEDHQDLLKEIAEKEKELMKRDKHLNRVTRSILKKIPGTKNRNIWLEEMSQGLPVAKMNEEKEESDLSGDEYKSINPPAKNKKKTLQQKRKQKEQLREKTKRKTAKIEKKKISDIHRLKHLKNHAELLDKKILLNKEKRTKLVELRKKQTKRLGAKKFEEKDLEFNMPTELTGSLRGVKKESNLLVDRFFSLQKRSIIPPSSRIQAKKPKIKKYIKPCHKDDWKTTIAGMKAS